jgi:lipopolysaccharide export system protein LptA
VRIQQNDRRARCDSADYIREDQQIVCRGHAELVQGCDHVRGEEIFIDLDGDRARVTGAPSLVIYPEGSEASSCPESTP